MSRKEVPRAGLVHAALVGRITTQQGATALRLSVRQVQRLKQRYQREGRAAWRTGAGGAPPPGGSPSSCATASRT